MFTKNWYKALASCLSRKAAPCIDAGGSERNLSVGYGWIGTGSSSDSYCPIGYVRTNLTGTAGFVAFGTGTTPPTLDDYTLSGNIVTGISTTAKVSGGFTDSGTEVSATYTITNNNDTAVTIGEIGAFGASGSTTGKGVMLERTVLESPITIEPGGVGQVTYTLRCDIQTA